MGKLSRVVPCQQICRLLSADVSAPISISSSDRSVAGTASAPALMEDMGFSAAFNVQLHVPSLKEADVRTVLTSVNAFSSADVSYLSHSQCYANP